MIRRTAAFFIPGGEDEGARWRPYVPLQKHMAVSSSQVPANEDSSQGSSSFSGQIVPFYICRPGQHVADDVQSQNHPATSWMKQMQKDTRATTCKPARSTPVAWLSCGFCPSLTQAIAAWPQILC